MPTAAGSVALAGLQTTDDAFQVQRLREAGAVILGKANMHELAAGITTISSLGGQSCNPYDPQPQPGRIERWEWRRGRGELRGGGLGFGHLRVDSHSLGGAQPVRVAADEGIVEYEWDRPALSHAGRRWTDRPHGDGPGDRARCHGRSRSSGYRNARTPGARTPTLRRRARFELAPRQAACRADVVLRRSAGRP